MLVYYWSVDAAHFLVDFQVAVLRGLVRFPPLPAQADAVLSASVYLVISTFIYRELTLTIFSRRGEEGLLVDYQTVFQNHPGIA